MLSESGPNRVLIVDDEVTVANSLQDIFSTAGYDARSVYSAEQACEAVANWVPDLAIIDVVLPRMNGIDLAISLRQHFPGCRFMLFSGAMDTGDILAAALANGHTFDLLAKPVHPLELLRWATAPGAA